MHKRIDLKVEKYVIPTISFKNLTGGKSYKVIVDNPLTYEVQGNDGTVETYLKAWFSEGMSPIFMKGHMCLYMRPSDLKK